MSFPRPSLSPRTIFLCKNPSTVSRALDARGAAKPEMIQIYFCLSTRFYCGDAEIHWRFHDHRALPRCPVSITIFGRMKSLDAQGESILQPIWREIRQKCLRQMVDLRYERLKTIQIDEIPAIYRRSMIFPCSPEHPVSRGGLHWRANGDAAFSLSPFGRKQIQNREPFWVSVSWFMSRYYDLEINSCKLNNKCDDALRHMISYNVML